MEYNKHLQKAKKSPVLAALLNFFLPGLGHIYRGHKAIMGVLFVIGFSGLTYVELNLQTQESPLFIFNFVSVFIINTALAIDTFQSTKYHNLRFES